jgi:hypothetical protein
MTTDQKHAPGMLPQSLLNLISEYGMARTDGLNGHEIMHRWELLIDGIKNYATAEIDRVVGHE